MAQPLAHLEVGVKAGDPVTTEVDLRHFRLVALYAEGVAAHFAVYSRPTEQFDARRVVDGTRTLTVALGNDEYVLAPAGFDGCALTSFERTGPIENDVDATIHLVVEIRK